MNKETKLSGSVIQGDGDITPPYSRKDVDKKFDQITIILLSVVVILIVMVATLVIDSFHINSATYKEYSNKMESVEITQNTNEVLLKQIQDWTEQNKKNQELIIQLQKQILNK